MKINEIIQEGIWDNLKTAGQQVRQGVGTVVNKVGQGARSAYNTVVQPQARQQRFAQTAAAQNLTPGQLRAKNIGTFAGDVAGTIAKASTGASYFTKATPTANIPNGETVDTELGKFKKTAQGWATETNTPVTDPNIVSKLNSIYQQAHPQTPQVDTSKIQSAPRAGQPTSGEQAKFQAKLQAALQNQQGQQ